MAVKKDLAVNSRVVFEALIITVPKWVDRYKNVCGLVPSRFNPSYQTFSRSQSCTY